MPTASFLKRRERLQEVAAASSTAPRVQKHTPFEPAKTRSCLVDTQRYFPSKTDEAKAASSKTAATTKANSKGAAGNRHVLNVEDEQYTASARAATNAAGTVMNDPSRNDQYQHLHNRTMSEWAELARLEHELHVEDQVALSMRKKAVMANQRNALDAQMEEYYKRLQREEEEKIAENEQLKANEVAARKKAKAMSETLAVHNAAIKKERQEQLDSVTNKKRLDAYMKREEEKRELQRAKEALAEEERRKAAKKAAHLEEMKLTLEENAREKMRKMAIKEAEKEEQERLNREYIAMLEKQDRDRAEALEKLYAASHARAAKAGESAGAAAIAKAKAADELEARMFAEKEAAFLRAQEEKRIQKEAMTAEMLQTLDMQQRAKAEREARDKREMVAFFDMVKTKDERAKENDRARQAYRRSQNIEHRKDLEAQMTEKRVRALGEDAMTETERRINMNLLDSVKLRAT